MVRALYSAFSDQRWRVCVRLERKRLEEVVAVCYSYRDYREEEEARKRRQEKLSRGREAEEARRARKKSTDRDRVLVKN